jgi:hypothetical protein
MKKRFRIVWKPEKKVVLKGYRTMSRAKTARINFLNFHCVTKDDERNEYVIEPYEEKSQTAQSF